MSGVLERKMLWAQEMFVSWQDPVARSCSRVFEIPFLAYCMTLACGEEGVGEGDSCARGGGRGSTNRNSSFIKKCDNFEYFL